MTDKDLLLDQRCPAERNIDKTAQNSYYNTTLKRNGERLHAMLILFTYPFKKTIGNTTDQYNCSSFA